MGIKETFNRAVDYIQPRLKQIGAFFRTEASLAAEALIAEDPVFARKLKKARDIVWRDELTIQSYMPVNVMTSYPGHSFGDVNSFVMAGPTSMDLIDYRAERERLKGSILSYKDLFKQAVYKICEEGRQVQSELDVRQKYPNLLRPNAFAR